MTTGKQPLTVPPPVHEVPGWRTVFTLPRTAQGWVAVLLGIVAAGLYASAWALLATGQHREASFFTHPLLATTMVAANAASLVAGATAAAAIMAKRERSLAVILIVALAIATVVFLGGALAVR